MGRAGRLLLALAALAGTSAAAPATVDVTVQAAFPAPPYIVELLEAAAEENSTSYFPLLGRIAEGYFDNAKTDKELYDAFLKVLQDDGHITDAHALSTWKLSLSLHAAAPRIEAHYQYWNSTARLAMPQGESKDVCVIVNGISDCSTESAPADTLQKHSMAALPIDRKSSGAANVPIIYADITSPEFRAFDSRTKSTGQDHVPYILRHKPPRARLAKPLAVSGYGVEMALKRTDYIVIDDRADSEAENEGSKSAQQKTAVLDDDETAADLKPLSSSELQRLGLKTASFVLESEDKFATLLKIAQDFPKYSAAIASGQVNEKMRSEMQENAAVFLPPGSNVIWINGIQMSERDLDAFSLLEQLRREHKLVAAAKALGLTEKQALDLITHSELTDAANSQDVQRYDWRDEDEGGKVIIWMNDIEKDRRYIDWPESLRALLKRTFPGQLPSVRRNIHHVTVPTDFSDREHIGLVIDGIQSFVKRGIPVRFGLVPLLNGEAAVNFAKVVYHLCDTYGLATVLGYLGTLADTADLAKGPTQALFDAAIFEKQLRKDRTAATFDQVLADDQLSARLDNLRSYASRLALTTSSAPYIANGVPIPRDEEWMQTMSNRVSLDFRILQEGVYTGVIEEETSIPDIFLAGSSKRRSALIIPEDEKDTKFPDLSGLTSGEDALFGGHRGVPANKADSQLDFAQVIVIGNFDQEHGYELLQNALQFRKTHDNVELFIVPSVPLAGDYTGRLSALISGDKALTVDDLEALRTSEGTPSDAVNELPDFDTSRALLQAIGSEEGVSALIVNGRVIGPFSAGAQLTAEDMDILFEYERQKRWDPAVKTLESLNIKNIAASPSSFANLVGFIARSQKAEAPEGIFDGSSTTRTSIASQLKGEQSSFEIGNIETASVQLTVAIDPASEIGQRWLPIVKVLTELDGVHARIFLNPKEVLSELPIKRFYRNVLHSQPEFDEAGAVLERGAHFGSLPADALLTIGMDLPPAWLVSPKDSVHDLDNLRLSSLKGDSVTAIYQLDHILIEGHSKDTTATAAPRGAQLALKTGNGEQVADTLIMANLGYFQFKANPGYYGLSLQGGRSQEVYKIDTIGLSGVEDFSTEFAMTSFRGTTLYPRLSRHAGMEKEDVLEPSKPDEKKNTFAGGVFDAIGLNDWFGKGDQNVADDKAIATLPHADINIFSVASGHLYERMLNIMMVSVMKHTSHTVKFWFIEQFLSPSFKAFLPILAEEYGFRYEMVTFKWPHWLRGQKEKQREIWGYKILFLDVLFPLDLNKVIFVDADQIVRTDMHELVEYDLQGAPYGFTPMCDSRVEMEGFRFWKQGYWANFLRGLPYHISALYVVDLARFRQMAAGDRLRQQYHQLSADPGSLSNLDQDLPNHMQHVLPIHSLPQEWLWCETWCSDESLGVAKTIDLCNNPQTKEPKLERARRQVPEWTVYDDEIAAVAKRKAPQESLVESGEQERLQKEEYEKKREEERAKAAAGDRIRDEL